MSRVNPYWEFFASVFLMPIVIIPFCVYFLIKDRKKEKSK